MSFFQHKKHFLVQNSLLGCSVGSTISNRIYSNIPIIFKTLIHHIGSNPVNILDYKRGDSSVFYVYHIYLIPVLKKHKVFMSNYFLKTQFICTIMDLMNYLICLSAQDNYISFLFKSNQCILINFLNTRNILPFQISFMFVYLCEALNSYTHNSTASSKYILILSSCCLANACNTAIINVNKICDLVIIYYFKEIFSTTNNTILKYFKTSNNIVLCFYCINNCVIVIHIQNLNCVFYLSAKK